MDGITIRQATAADTERIAEIMAGEPGPEATAIVGNVTGARRLWMEMVRVSGSPMGWEFTTVPEADGIVLGVLEAGDQESSIKITPGLAVLALRVAGPLGIVGLVRRLCVGDRVKPAPVPALTASENCTCTRATAVAASEAHFWTTPRPRREQGATPGWR